MKTYRLLKDIANPDHDKRVKHGYQQYETFKAGTFFEGMPASLDKDNRFEPAYVYCKEWRHLSSDTAALIIGNSIEAEPSNWHEIATALGGYHHLGGDVIEKLLKDGIVTIEQVKNALSKVIQE
jgi:hypothetical protein